MPANKRQQVAQMPASPVPKPPTAKYTNKDGTKSITIAKSSASTPPAQPSPTTTAFSKGGLPTAPALTTDDALLPPVNRKKQKRRAKAAAKAAAAAEDAALDNGSNGLPSPPVSTISTHAHTAATSTPRKGNHNHSHVPLPEIQSHPAAQNGDCWDDDETESDDEHQTYATRTNGPPARPKMLKKKKKQRDPLAATSADEFVREMGERSAGISRDEKIWNTSSAEERERIKQFWLGLGEDERKSLVKVEKDAVLKKMKEQQKHTCSCTVCGRKRTAIEEELEGLYDAYYEELESFANQPQNHPNGPPMLGRPGRLGQMSGLHPPRSLPSGYPSHHPSKARIVEHIDNDEEEDDDDVDDEEYSDEDDLDEDEEGEPEDIPEDNALDLFNFGQSLTVQGGILTVADDLLKNDGKKFIEMMEQLAERRMAREEDAKDHYSYGHSNGTSMNAHNHAPAPDDEEYDDEEEDDEEYDSNEEDYDEEEDTMTEEQRMEEGRRMFQIFAARMFEQRVLTAYKEKVARERQAKLLEELEDETRQDAQKKAKKAKEAQKRKEKAAQKKQVLAEEKSRKDAEKAAAEAERVAEAQRRAEEAKNKAEEKRRKKEQQKRAEEEDRIRKEAERQKRASEAKQRQAEQERKAREFKEREKKLKEEQRAKEKEAREQKERETRERREKHEQDKRDKEQRAAQAKAERDAKEKQKQEEKAAQKAAALAATPIPIPSQPKKQQHLASIPALPQQSLAHPSPQIAVATPVLPKAPIPMKPRTASQEVTRSQSQTSFPSSGASQNASPRTHTPAHSSPGPAAPPRKSSSVGFSHAPPGLSMSPLHAGIKSPPGFGQGGFPAMPPVGMPYPSGMHMNPGFNPMPVHAFAPMANNFRPPPGGMPFPPPGLPGPMGRGFPLPGALPPGFPGSLDALPSLGQHFPGHENMGPGSLSPHSRQASASFDGSPLEPKISGASAQPIARPAPIGRPSMITQGLRQNDNSDAGNVSHLGSSALLDDTDEAFADMASQPRRNTVAPGTRPPFTAAPVPFVDPIFGSPLNQGGWGGPHSVFAPVPPPGMASSMWPSNTTFGASPPAPRLPRPITVRLMLVQACKDLENHATDADGFIDVAIVKGHVDSINTSDPVSESELLSMCETEGNPHNGDGSFDIRQEKKSGKPFIRYDPAGGTLSMASRNVGAPGQLSSPNVRASGLFGSRS